MSGSSSGENAIVSYPCSYMPASGPPGAEQWANVTEWALAEATRRRVHDMSHHDP